MIVMDDFNSLSKEIGFLANLESDVRERLVNVGNFETKKSGDYLSVQGQAHSKMSLIISGEVSVKIRANGESLTVMNLGPSDVVGEMSVIDPQRLVPLLGLFQIVLNYGKYQIMILLIFCYLISMLVLK